MVIFHRLHMINQTFIKNNPKYPCKAVEGYDGNSLYPGCMMDEMPTGFYVRRLAPHFKPEPRTKFEKAFIWLDYLNNFKHANITHARNGKEKRVGPYLVDGYDAQTDTAYEFDGCYYHGCPCISTANKTERQITFQEKRRERTYERQQFIKKYVKNLVVMKECEFKKCMDDDEDLKSFAYSRYPQFFRTRPYGASEATILGAVSEGTLFGMVECDIFTPRDK